jgi:TyrR family helix-turn-helix protein
MRLEVSCALSINIVCNVLDILATLRVELTGLECRQDKRIYLALSDLALSDTQLMLSQLRRIDGVDDARIIDATPSEVEQCEVQLLMDQVLFPVVLVDRAGVIRQSNPSFEYAIGDESRQVVGCEANRFMKGFSLTRWLSAGHSQRDSVTLYLNSRLYQAEIIPVSDNSSTQAHAGVMLLFHHANWMTREGVQRGPSVEFNDIGLVAKSKATVKIIEQLEFIAQDPYPILLFGESGVGKRFYGQLLNQIAGFSDEQVTTVDCTLLADVDEATEIKSSIGFKTVILDGVEILSAEQLESIFSRLKHSKTDAVLWVMCSSLGPVELMAHWGETTFYKFVLGSLEIPPLRHRKEDIVPLAEAWLQCQFTRKQAVVPPLSRAIKRYLVDLNWPGNIPQLWHVLRDTLNSTEHKRWKIKDIKYENNGVAAGVDLESLFALDYHDAMRQFERLLISHHYPQHPSTRQLAKKLGISHTAIANKLREHRIR